MDHILEPDAKILRAMAHPLRLRMLGLLRSEGPATATSLAARLGESSGTTSWHLRQLADLGLIEEDVRRGNRRERWWQAAHEYTAVRIEKLADEPQDAAVFSEFLHEVLRAYYRNATTFVAEPERWSRDWLEAGDLSDYQLWLTPAELVRMRRDLEAVVKRYQRMRAPGDEQVAVQWQLFPR